MIKLVLLKQKEKKYLISLGVFFLIFLFIYFMLDYLSGGYKPMLEDFGTYLVVLNVLVNVVMSVISAVMFNFSTALQSLSKRGENTGMMPFLSVIFGFFTFGCTSCMIAFLAVLGINFAVIPLAMHNFPYKLIGLGLLVIVFIIQLYIIKNSKCKI